MDSLQCLGYTLERATLIVSAPLQAKRRRVPVDGDLLTKFSRKTTHKSFQLVFDHKEKNNEIPPFCTVVVRCRGYR
ncbi:hypothetical protein CCHOA_01505 [Corynebacterium choanae]|uniref:Uncharacterized protein n=1 Tax=Corynebacterium choanae TaxID=1862358 RepID=A0A3G6J470_9CORY|nr:hypothetical protein CCHOA_01505 [Corynebacterium choanae]